MTGHELLRVQKKLDGERIKKKESEEMSDQKYSVLKLRLSLNLEETDLKDRVVLNRYGKVKQGIIREVLVPADITLHALHYVIQRAFWMAEQSSTSVSFARRSFSEDDWWKE